MNHIESNVMNYKHIVYLGEKGKNHKEPGAFKIMIYKHFLS